MGAAMSGRSRLEDQVANLRKKLADTQRSMQRSQRDKESYLVRLLGKGVKTIKNVAAY